MKLNVRIAASCLIAAVMTFILCRATEAQTSAANYSSSNEQVASPQVSGSPNPSQSLAKALPNAPSPHLSADTYTPQPSDSYVARAGYMCGAGSSTSSAATKPTVGCGIGFSFVPLPIFVELGLMGPQANRSNFSGYVSVDGSIPFADVRDTYGFMGIVGYSRLFETGHALDYGVALALPHPRQAKGDSSSMRIELRDYWTFANPSQHNVMLRVGWMFQEYD